MNTLKNVKVGETVSVTRINGVGPTKRRIMDMGLTKGVDDLCTQSRTARRSHRTDSQRL